MCMTIKLFSFDLHLHVIIMGNKEVNLILLMMTRHVNLARSFENFNTNDELELNNAP